MFDKVLSKSLESTAVYNNKLNQWVKNHNEKVLIINLLNAKLQLTSRIYANISRQTKPVAQKCFVKKVPL